VAASTHYGSRLPVAEQWPYWPKVATVPALIKSGTIGPTLISSTSYYYKSKRDNVPSGSVDAATGGLGWRGQLARATGGLGWRGQLARAGGSIALDCALHWIWPIRELTSHKIARMVGVGLQPALQMEGEPYTAVNRVGIALPKVYPVTCIWYYAQDKTCLWLHSIVSMYFALLTYFVVLHIVHTKYV